jgi:extracellular factor (EF) 3-hydroxypalmitic acid methyl ester biosynthesis protein
MENGLKYLTHDDLRLLTEKANRVSFTKDQELIAQNSKNHAVFILRRGLVRVERSHLGRGIAITRLGPGDVIGELSYLDPEGANASVIADDDVEADVIEREVLDSLLRSMPAFETRFYRSLALVLSHRLRDITSQLPNFLIEDVSQVKRFHAPRTGLNPDKQIPIQLQNDLEQFKTAMLQLDREIAFRTLSDLDAQTKVTAACSALMASLRQYAMHDSEIGQAVGAHVFRETFPWLMLGRLNDRSFAKPRGYAGDYATIEMMYQNQPAGDGRLGRFIDAWCLEQKCVLAVKNRRRLLAEAILRELEKWQKPTPMPVTSMGSGPAREIFDVLRVPHKPNLHATLIDIDPEALRSVSRTAEKEGLTAYFTLAKDNLVRLAKGNGNTKISPQQLMYSVGLIDYLQDQFVVALLDWTYDQLLPGGTVILGNFDSTNPDKPYMDYIVEWVLIHRSREDMENLFRQSKFQASTVDVQSEETGVNLFAFSTKPA